MSSATTTPQYTSSERTELSVIEEELSSSSMEQDCHESLSRLKPNVKAHISRYLQDLDNADVLPDPTVPVYHTGKIVNSKSGDGKPRLLLMGQKRSGKSSITSVVFHKLPPSDTLYLETTTQIKKDAMHSFMDFQIWDFPGHIDFLDPSFDQSSLFGEIGALIWVIDAQDEYLEALQRLTQTILTLHNSYPLINIEIFVHKVDGLSEEYRADVYRDIIMRVQDELLDNGIETGEANVSFYQTSIYDHSIFEAFSKVIQKLIPQLPALEALLSNLVRSCRMEKAYLFDVLSKIYIATDTNPASVGDYEICSDYVDMIVDICEIYMWRELAPGAGGTPAPPDEFKGDALNPGEGIEEAESLITIERRKGTYLYLKELNRHLALICLMAPDAPPDCKAMIDYNVGVFQEALRQVFPR